MRWCIWGGELPPVGWWPFLPFPGPWELWGVGVGKTGPCNFSPPPPQPSIYMGQRLANFPCKGPESRYFRFCGPYRLCLNHSVLPLQQERSCRPCLNKRRCSHKTYKNKRWAKRLKAALWRLQWAKWEILRADTDSSSSLGFDTGASSILDTYILSLWPSLCRCQSCHPSYLCFLAPSLPERPNRWALHRWKAL